MKRLTKRMGGISYSMCDNVIIAKCENCTHRQPSCYDEDCQAELDVTTHLAAYEDTDTTPKQVVELVEKATPKEAVNVAYMALPAMGKCLDFGNCPVCGREAQPYFQHCMYCGQALKWPEPTKEE